MRKAFYYDSAMPPKKWLILSSLLWDRVWISPQIVLWIKEPGISENFKNDFLVKLYQSGLEVLDSTGPKADISEIEKISSEDRGRYTKLITRFAESFIGNHLPLVKCEDFLKKAIVFSRTGDRGSAQRMHKKAGELINSHERKLIKEATEFNHSFYNSEFKALYPDLDYFFEQELSFKNYWPNSNKVFTYSVSALLPVNPELITIPQIKDFRDLTAVQRLRFKTLSENVLHEIMSSTTENDLERSIKTFKAVLDEELQVLQSRYETCRIETAVKSISVITGIPALMSIFGHALNIPIYEPASIISGCSLSGALSRAALTKGKIEINNSPWGLLTSLKKLN